MFSLNDPGPLVSWSVLDHERRPKLGWSAVREACRPVIVVADRPPAIVTTGEVIRLDVHVVNDLRRQIDAADVTVVAAWPGGRRRWRFAGVVEADAVDKVGTIELEVPNTLGGLAFDLTLTAGDVQATNHYTAAITTA